MEIGLLWYDGDSRRALEDKIERAARRYHDKFGRWPNTCYVHPQAVIAQPGHDQQVAFRLQDPSRVIKIVSASNVLLHHFWLGETNGRVNGRGKQAEN
jgi:hypothetical protein